MAADIFRRHAIHLQEVANQIAHMVATRLRHHDAVHACPSERDDAVERRAARHSLLRLIVLEEDVKYGFSDADDARGGHKGGYLCEGG